MEANKRLTKQTLEFLKKISELPSPDNPHDIKIRKTQNEKIGKGFKEAKTAFEQLDVNIRSVRGHLRSTRLFLIDEKPSIKWLELEYFDA